MSMKYVSLERLSYFAEKIAGKFVKQQAGKGLSANDLTAALKQNYDKAYTHSTAAHAPSNAERNTVVGLQRNGADLTASSDRKINLTFGALADKSKIAEADLETTLLGKVTGASNASHTHKNWALLEDVTAAKVSGWDAAQPNVIESVKVNGTALTVTGKAVNVTVPTTVAGLSDAGNYAKTANVYAKGEVYSKAEVDSKVSSVYRYKGSKANYAALPTSGQIVGDVYNVEAADAAHGIKAGDNVAWNGTVWDALAGTVDLSGYVQNSDLSEVTEAEIDAMFA